MKYANNRHSLKSPLLEEYMRITNTMVSNTMLGNINRNQTAVHRIMNQMSTQRLISSAHENPLMAARHLRIENTRAQIAQHQSNVNHANAWTEITEKAVEDLTRVMTRLEELLNRADSVETLEDKRVIATDINALISEKRTIMNTTFSGRHIFSGHRTDQPPFFNRDMPNLEFTDITTQFSLNDLETTPKLDRSGMFETPPNLDSVQTVEVSRLRLPHNGNADSVRINGSAVPSIDSSMRLPNGEINLSALSSTGIYHDPETGSLISLSNSGFDFTGGLTVEYDQTGFSEGCLNPVVFFTATDQNGTTFNMNNQNMSFEFGVGTHLNINLLAKNLVTGSMFADIRGFSSDILNLNLNTEATLRSKGITDENEITEFLTRERAMADTITADRFNNLIGRMSAYQDSIASQQTDLGTRMVRIDMIGERLESDSLTFEELSTNNIGTNMAEAATRLMTAELALTAAMQVGMHNLMTLTLLNFL